MPIGTSDGQNFANQWEHAMDSLTAPTSALRPASMEDMSSDNMKRAQSDLALTPQETALYQRHLWNLNGPGGVSNSDGSRSTLFQISIDHDGQTFNVPTVYDGKILNTDDAIKRAVRTGLDNFPAYANADDAEERYNLMHDYMAQDTQEYLKFRMRADAEAKDPLAKVINEDKFKRGIELLKQENGVAPPANYKYLKDAESDMEKEQPKYDSTYDEHVVPTQVSDI